MCGFGIRGSASRSKGGSGDLDRDYANDDCD